MASPAAEELALSPVNMGTAAPMNSSERGSGSGSMALNSSSRFGAGAGDLSARRTYPRRTAADRAARWSAATAGEETFEKFRTRTIPTTEDIKENVFDKSA